MDRKPILYPGTVLRILTILPVWSVKNAHPPGTSLPDKKTFPEVTLYDMRSLTERAQFYGALAVLVHCSQIPGVTNCQCTKACQEASVLRTIQKAFWAALKPRDNAEQWTQGAFRKGIILSQSHLRQDRRAEVQRSPWSDASFENAGLNMVD